MLGCTQYKAALVYSDFSGVRRHSAGKEPVAGGVANVSVPPPVFVNIGWVPRR